MLLSTCTLHRFHAAVNLATFDLSASLIGNTFTLASDANISTDKNFRPDYRIGLLALLSRFLSTFLRSLWHTVFSPVQAMWTSRATAWKCRWGVDMVTMASWLQRSSWGGRSSQSSSWLSRLMLTPWWMATLLFCATQTELWLINITFDILYFYVVLRPAVKSSFFFQSCWR